MHQNTFSFMMKDNKNVMWQFSTLSATLKRVLSMMSYNKCNITIFFGTYIINNTRGPHDVRLLLLFAIIMCAHNYKWMSNTKHTGTSCQKLFLTTFFRITARVRFYGDNNVWFLRLNTFKSFCQWNDVYIVIGTH